MYQSSSPQRQAVNTYVKNILGFFLFFRPSYENLSFSTQKKGQRKKNADSLQQNNLYLCFIIKICRILNHILSTNSQFYSIFVSHVSPTPHKTQILINTRFVVPTSCCSSFLGVFCIYKCNRVYNY